MHWADIIASLQKKGSSLTQIAGEEEVQVSAVSNVIKGKSTSHNIAFAIAAKTDIPVERLWPGKYLTPDTYQQARRGHSAGRLPEQLEEVTHG